MYKPHTYCRACGYAKTGAQGIKSIQTEKLIEAFDLGVQPLANDFCKEGEPRAGYAPLKVMYCPRCSLAQLSVVVDPSILYRHYCYVTSPSNMMQDHFLKIIGDIRDETDCTKVLEIGSNDGRLLSLMQSQGFDVTGVDPAENLVSIAQGQGVNTVLGLFSEYLAKDILGQYDIVIARHVFCHVDDWQDFVKGLEVVSHKDTLICIEVPYARDTLDKGEFDQIYHEHLSFMSLRAMQSLLEPTKLFIHKVDHYSIHGGALMIMIRHKDFTGDRRGNVLVTDSIPATEWIDLSRKSRDQINRLKGTVGDLVDSGKRVAGLGASAKSTVWISACGFSRKQISFIADSTPQKQYTFSPGTDIPVVDEGAILRELPDYMIVFCWNYLSEVIDKNKLYLEKGGKFIVPVPSIQIISKDG